MSIPGKTLSRVLLNLREGSTAGVPDTINVTYEISRNSSPSVTTRKRIPMSFTAGDLSTLTAQQLWNAVISSIEIAETNSQAQITTSSLPNAQVGSAYSYTLSAIDYQSPGSWTVSPALPTGMSLLASTGAISGTPTASSTANYSFTLTDANGLVDTRVLQLVVNP